MTPAENPNASDRKRTLVRFPWIASRLPIPVARPAKSVSAKPMSTFSVNMAIL